MAYSRIYCFNRQLFTNDVLHNGCRLDALLFFILQAQEKFVGLNTDGVANVFSEMLQKTCNNDYLYAYYVVVGFFICSIGLQNGLEKVTKVMMVALLAIMVILAINSFFMKGAKEGLSFLSNSKH